tara:strand:- start:744 stop:1922 length:1179 start_codon:yes stop_codon:yes gene_type:complete
MTYTPFASDTFTNVAAGTTNFTITWEYTYNPYYTDTDAVKATVNGAAWTVSSVSGSTVTLASGIPANATVIIYRETDLSENVITFNAGSTLKSEDLNSDFDQLLFASQEFRDIDESLQTQITGISNSINNLIVFVETATVATLNTIAGGLTTADAGKAYEVLNSTSIDSAANPVVNNLPANVTWDSTIQTKVKWNGASWDYVIYAPANPDVRYAFKSGDTFTGDINIPATTSSTPSTAAVTKAYVDALSSVYVDVAGDTMTGDLIIPTTTSGTSNSAAVTKLYVDTAVAGSVSNTTYTYTSSSVTGGANLTLTGSDSSTNSVKLEGAGLVNITQASNVVTLSVGNSAFIENTRTVTSSYSIAAGNGAHSVGPISVNSGATVTVPSTSLLIII